MVGTISGIMEKMHKVQESYKASKRELDQQEFVGEAGAGMVRAVVSGDRQLKSLMIEDGIYTEGKEVVAELTIAAVNIALDKAGSASSTMMHVMARQFGLE